MIARDVSAERVVRMYRRGMTILQISDDLGVSRHVVANRLNEANEPRRPGTATLQMMRAAKRRLDARKQT